MPPSETVTAQAHSDGFVSFSVHRIYESGSSINSTLHVLIDDVPAVADAIERYAREGAGSETVQLKRGTLTLFHMYRSSLIHIELRRRERARHGGYHTLSFLPQSAGTLTAAMWQAAVEGPKD